MFLSFPWNMRTRGDWKKARWAFRENSVWRASVPFGTWLIWCLIQTGAIIMCSAGGFILCRNWDNFLKLMMLMFTCSLVSILLGLLHLPPLALNLANALWLCSVKQEASFMTVAKESVNYVVIFLFRVSSYEWYLLIKGNLLFSNFANTPSYIYTNVPAICVGYPKYQKKNGSNKKLVDQLWGVSEAISQSKGWRPK